MMNVNQLSEKLLLAVKMQAPAGKIITDLKELSLASLVTELDSDANKKAFWINLYNAFFQVLRREQNLVKPEVYRKKLINIAGQLLSLDDIEHGILRKYRFKWALGYLPDPFAAAVVKNLSVSKIDYRIHFALNCGAKSCPPIAFYSPDKIERQLDMAMISFLEDETEFFSDKNELHISQLFQWFIGDFGGRRGLRKIVQETLRLETEGVKLVFKAYNWEEELNNFKKEQAD